MFDFNDWGSWGVGDFYEGNDEELRTAIESGEPFDTGWHGFKKELESMRIHRDKNGVEVEVYAYMDEALEQTDLFCDFLTDDEINRLTDEMLEEIREALYMGDFVEETQCSLTRLNPTFEEVMRMAETCKDICQEELHNSFIECIANTLYIMYADDPNKNEIVKQRIKEYD